MTENTSTPWPTYLPGQSAIHGDWFNGFGTSQPQLLNPSDPAFRPPIVFDRGTTTDLAAAVDFGAMAEGSVLSGDGTGSIANSDWRPEDILAKYPNSNPVAPASTTASGTSVNDALNRTFVGGKKHAIDVAEHEFLQNEELRSISTFMYGGNPFDSNIPDEKVPILPPGVSFEPIRESVAEQIDELYNVKVIGGMDAYIRDFYKKNLHPDLFFPRNLQLVAQYMIANGFDIHTRDLDEKVNNDGAPDVRRSTYENLKAAGLLDLLGDKVRLSKLTAEASQDSQGNPLVVSHFSNDLLKNVLIAGLTIYLTECPHLRTMFYANERVPRSAMAVPALRLYAYWRSLETGFPVEVEVDPWGFERLASYVALLDFIRNTDEAAKLAVIMYDVTLLVFVPPLPELPEKCYTRVPYYAPRHRLKPPNQAIPESRRYQPYPTTRPGRNQTADESSPSLSEPQQPIASSSTLAAPIASSTATSLLTGPGVHIPRNRAGTLMGPPMFMPYQ